MGCEVVPKRINDEARQLQNIYFFVISPFFPSLLLQVQADETLTNNHAFMQIAKEREKMKTEHLGPLPRCGMPVGKADVTAEYTGKNPLRRASFWYLSL